uniref:Uncharacterized protein n=1 Tax=Cacopsylla melanoneura TaxID=428564 RepID=A0A8D8PU18_9HEMI
MGVIEPELLTARKSAIAFAIPLTPPANEPSALKPANIGIAAGKKPPLTVDGTLRTRGILLLNILPRLTFFAANKANLASDLMFSLFGAVFIPTVAALVSLRNENTFFLFFLIPAPIFRLTFIALVTNQAADFSGKLESLASTLLQAAFSNCQSASFRFDEGFEYCISCSLQAESSGLIPS